jgi:hypothetical protein
MVVVREESTGQSALKPLFCPKCEKGRIGTLPSSVRARRGKRGGGSADTPIAKALVYVKCGVCGANVELTFDS